LKILIWPDEKSCRAFWITDSIQTQRMATNLDFGDFSLITTAGPPSSNAVNDFFRRRQTE